MLYARTKHHLCVILAIALLIGLTASGIFTPSANATEDLFELVTDTGELSVGDQIIITNQVSGTGAYAISTAQNDSNRGSTFISIENNIATPTADTQILTLEAGASDGTFALFTGNGYLYAASNSSNQLKTQKELTEKGSWTLSVNATGQATIQAQGVSRNLLRFYASSALFSCYSSGQKPVYIYKLITSAPADATDTEGKYIAFDGRSVVPDDKLYFRYYFKLGTELSGQSLSDYTVGMEYWDHEPVLGTDQPQIFENYGTYNGTYFTTGGLTPQEMTDTQWYRLYITVGNTVYYTPIQSFDLYTYHDALINAGLMSEGETLDDFIDAAIAYGQAARAYRPA